MTQPTTPKIKPDSQLASFLAAMRAGAVYFPQFMKIKAIKRSSAPGNYESILSYLNSCPKGAKILDCPAGRGALTQMLLQHGFKNVIASDIFPEFFEVPGHLVEAADMNHRLPWQDGIFDVVICCDGLGDIDNIDNAIKEFSRVLTKDGALFVAIPNILSVRSRLRFLLVGFYNKFPSPFDEKNGARTKRPIPFWELKYAMSQAGLIIDSVKHNRLKAADWLLSPLAIPLGGVTYLRSFFSAKIPGAAKTLRYMSRWSLLCGESIIVGARKMAQKAP